MLNVQIMLNKLWIKNLVNTIGVFGSNYLIHHDLYIGCLCAVSGQLSLSLSQQMKLQHSFNLLKIKHTGNIAGLP